MIDLTAQRSADANRTNRTMKIIGIGGAGANALDRMVLDGVNAAHLVAVNTDTQALTASMAGSKIQLGQAATRGLGCGGDPDLGHAAALEASGELRSAVEGLDAVFLLAGLGGGTGSGAIPLIAEAAREAGALVIAVVTLPFAFEGKRRVAQAVEALAALEAQADAVICFENDRMADHVSPNAGIAQAFLMADQTISQSVQAVTALFHRKGLIHLGFDDLRAALRGSDRGNASARTLFGYGEAEGDNRPFDALAKALKNPLMDKGRLLRDCERILVQVSGGPDMTLNEVQLLMEELNRRVENRTRLLFGAAVDPRLGGRIAVTILSSLDVESGVASLPQEPRAESVVKAPVFSVVAPPAPEEEALEEPAEEPSVVFAVEEPEEQEVSALEIEPPPPPIRHDFLAQEEEEPEEQEMATLEEERIITFEEEPPSEASEAEEEWMGETAETAVEEEPVEEPIEDEPEREPAPVVASQASLFGDEEPSAVEEEPAPLPQRAVRPLPGRTLTPPRPVASPPPEAVPIAEIEEAPSAFGVPETLEASPASSEMPEEPVYEEPTYEESVYEAPTEEEPSELEPEPEPAPVIPRVSPPAAVAPRRSEAPAPLSAPPVAPVAPTAPKAPQQETMKFESVARGRFEKSEPTIVDGQDLDVPTFLRQNIRIRP